MRKTRKTEKTGKPWAVGCPVCRTVMLSKLNTMDGDLECPKCHGKYSTIGKTGFMIMADRQDSDAEKLFERVEAYVKELGYTIQ